LGCRWRSDPMGYGSSSALSFAVWLPLAQRSNGYGTSSALGFAVGRLALADAHGSRIRLRRWVSPLGLPLLKRRSCSRRALRTAGGGARGGGIGTPSLRCAQMSRHAKHEPQRET